MSGAVALYIEKKVGANRMISISLSVYLPPGVWKDGIDGSLRKGSRWLHNYRVPKDKVAYFVKMPDNTRF